MERETLFDAPRFATREARIGHQADLIEVLGAIFRERDRADWCARLEARDVPYAPMCTCAEVPDDAQARHLQLFVQADVQTEHPTLGTFRTHAPAWRRTASANPASPSCPKADACSPACCSPTPTCSAHSGLQAGIAARARRMRIESPASPPAQPLASFSQRERESIRNEVTQPGSSSEINAASRSRA